MMINKTHEGKWVRLKGISGHGKNRIREHGDVWLVQTVWINKIMLRSKDLTFKSGKDMIFDGRWVSIPIDKNFEIIGVDV
tara:strand:+ start:146 stop:385 length:240 start_codon:yes stop_codon:yes gene_type:complete